MPAARQSARSTVRRFCALLTAGGLLAAVPGCVLIPPPGPPLTIGPDGLPNAAEGAAYFQQFVGDGTPPGTWSVSAGQLPPGLTLDPVGGVLSGTPTAAGTFTFNIRVQDSSYPLRIGEAPYSVTVVPRLVIAPALPPARVGVAYAAAPAVTGGLPPYQFQIEGLPAGLGWDPATGVISGTPVLPYASVPLEITVHDAGPPQQVATTPATLVIKPRPVAIATAQLAAGRVGSFYSQQLTATDGQPPYRWAVLAGVLPDNLRLNLTSGVISGFPTAAGTFTFTIQVADSDVPPTTAAQELTITIEP